MSNNLLKQYNDSESKHNDWHGRESVDGLTTTDEISCTTAGVTIATITTDKKGYVTTLIMTNTHTADQTFTLADTGGTKFSNFKIAAGATVIISEKYPFIVLDAGAITGTASTSNHIKVMMTYFEQ